MNHETIGLKVTEYASMATLCDHYQKIPQCIHGRDCLSNQEQRVCSML